jgi:ABC-type multidrug transport system fused ATPase/permease subunit
VSFKRIEEYLNAPEVTANREDSATISFENASIAWPSDEEKDVSEQYVLRDINISFPDKELSVISGKTGTGKSLLLNAILGETDLLAGKINVPTAPSRHDRHDDKATKDNWIIPSSIAYVAQIPWIENATIKNNILFGLPFDEYRYNKTLEVCALKKDLEILSDGENTEIGAQGINLSGGQKWRLTFARALYSRAGILVLDDLFSALDAHVGRYIFENGLTGELGAGRTRILVTHHVALCKSRTKYLVELGEGTVENAGLVSKLEEDGLLTTILSHVETDKEIEEDQVSTAVASESSDIGDGTGEPLTKVDTKASAKKFVEEEGRETGAIKTAIYMGYLKSSGGFPFWTGGLILFACQQVLTLGKSNFSLTLLFAIRRPHSWLRCLIESVDSRGFQKPVRKWKLTALGRSWILKIWTGHAEESTIKSMFTYTHQIPTVNGHNAAQDTLLYYLSLYVGISIVCSLIGAFKIYYVFSGSIRASRILFEKVTYTVLRTPLRWVDTVPLGRILNRFTADFNTVDSRLAYDLSFSANSIFSLVGIVIAGYVHLSSISMVTDDSINTEHHLILP